MTESTQSTSKKVIRGTVVSDAMDKTVVVLVNTFKTDKKYNKKYKSSKKYKVHDEENTYKVGSFVPRIVSEDPTNKLLTCVGFLHILPMCSNDLTTDSGAMLRI